MRLLWLLAGCGPSPVEVATTAVAGAGVEEAKLHPAGEEAWTFAGTRHGLPCRGTVRGAVVETGVCAPADAEGAPLALYRHLAELGLAELKLTGGPERWVIHADGCTGNATRHPGGALSGEARCGDQRHPFANVFPDRPRTPEELAALKGHVEQLAAERGLEQVSVAVDPAQIAFRGLLRDQPCEGRLDLREPVEELKLDVETCPGAGPPPEALKSRAAWLQWLLTDQGFTDVVVGPGEELTATLKDERLQGTARFKDERVTVALAGRDRTIVRLAALPEGLAE